MKPKRQVTFYVLGVVAVTITACAARGSSTPTPVLLTQATKAIPPSPTASVTSTLILTITPQPTTTEIPTRQPSDVFWTDVQKYGVTSASTVGLNGEVYSFYLLTDGEWYPGMCLLYVERWDGRAHITVWEKEESGLCEPVHWDALSLPTADRKVLKLDGYWSDINQNGLPEFAIFHGSGCAGCDDRNWGHTAIYEIQGPAQVKDIVADLSGEMLLITPLWDLTTPIQILHSDEPVTVYVTALFQYDTHSYGRVAWIYQWDGEKYVNVSTQYADEFRLQVKHIVAELQKQYGQPFLASGSSRDERILAILVLYNGAGLPQKEGLETFLEVTNPIHWPNTDKLTMCWLQLTRAHAQMDYEQKLPLRIFPPVWWSLGAAPDFNAALLELTKEIDTTRFDVSACD